MSSVGTQERVLWLALGTSFFFLAPAGVILASKEEYWDDRRILRRGNVVFFRGSTQLDWTTWSQTDGVEVRFRSSDGNQLRDGMAMARAHADPLRPLRDGCGAVELMVELLPYCMFLPAHAPLMALDWSAWTQAWAIATLCGVVVLARLPADENALHSLRIGGATFMSAGRASVDTVQRKGT